MGGHSNEYPSCTKPRTLAAICDQSQNSSNTILNMKLVIALLIAAIIFSCNGKKASKKNGESQLSYELVSTWPELSKVIN